MDNYHRVMEKMKIVDILKGEYCAYCASTIRVTRGQFPILKTLTEHDGCTQVELSHYLHLSAPAIAKALQRLEKANYIIKKKDEGNKRVFRLHITPLGEESLKQAEVLFDQFDVRLFQEIPTEMLRTFEETLDRMIFHITGSSSMRLEDLKDYFGKGQGGFQL